MLMTMPERCALMIGITARMAAAAAMTLSPNTFDVTTGSVGDASRQADAGIVDQDVDAAELANRRIGHLLDGAVHRHICRNDDG